MNLQRFQQNLDSLARFFLYLLIFWIPFSNAVIESCVITVFFLWLVKKSLSASPGALKNLTAKKKIQEFLRGFKVKGSFLNIPIAVFLYMGLLSALWSRAPFQSLHGLISKTLEWFVIYFLVLEFFTEKKYIIVALAVFLFSAVSVCADSLIQFYITGKDVFFGYASTERATACFYTGNGLGGYLLFALSLSAGFFIAETKNKPKTIIFGLIFLLAFWVLVITFSRGAWVAMAFGAVAFLFFKKRILSYLLMLCLVVLAVDFFFILPSDIKQKIRIDPQEMLGTAGWRRDVWQDSLKMVRDKPWLGHGPNTFMKIFQQDQYRRRPENRSYDPTYAHNCYVQMAAEVGLLGLGCFLWILGRFFRNIGRMILDKRIQDRSGLKMILLGLLIGSFSFCVHSFLDTHFYSLKLSSLFWFIMGLSVCLHKILSQPEICDIT